MTAEELRRDADRREALAKAAMLDDQRWRANGRDEYRVYPQKGVLYRGPCHRLAKWTPTGCVCPREAK